MWVAETQTIRVPSISSTTARARLLPERPTHSPPSAEAPASTELHLSTGEWQIRARALPSAPTEDSPGSRRPAVGAPKPARKEWQRSIKIDIHTKGRPPQRIGRDRVWSLVLIRKPLHEALHQNVQLVVSPARIDSGLEPAKDVEPEDVAIPRSIGARNLRIMPSGIHRSDRIPPLQPWKPSGATPTIVYGRKLI